MANILMIFNRIVWILAIVILTVLIWKTAEYFNNLQMHDKSRSLIAWDTLMLSLMLIFVVARLIVV